MNQLFENSNLLTRQFFYSSNVHHLQCLLGGEHLFQKLDMLVRELGINALLMFRLVHSMKTAFNYNFRNLRLMVLEPLLCLFQIVLVHFPILPVVPFVLGNAHCILQGFVDFYEAFGR